MQFDTNLLIIIGVAAKNFEKYNQRFAKEPASSHDTHRKTLPLILSYQTTHTLSKNLEP